MITLKDVTLVAVTSVRHKAHQEVLSISSSKIKFGVVMLLDLNTHTIGEWNEVIIKKLPKFITTSHCMLIHDDGYIIHPELWNPEWLKLDYIGAPWPLPKDDFSYRDEEGQIQRVGNSVSLRSKKLMDLAATRPVKYRHGNNNEDGHICCWNRKWLESQGCTFATFEQALDFSKETELPENFKRKTFAFHSV